MIHTKTKENRTIPSTSTGVDCTVADVETGRYPDATVATGTGNENKHKEDTFHDIFVSVNGDDGNCLPSTEEIHFHHVKLNTPSTKQRSLFYNWKITIIFLIIFIVLLLSLVAIVSNNFSSSDHRLVNNDTDAEDDATTASTTGTPSSSIQFTANYNRTMDYLLQQNVSTYESLITYGTPQYYAASYIANTLQLPAPNHTLTTTNALTKQALTKDLYSVDNQEHKIYRYIARYVLAVNYYHFTTYNDNHYGSESTNQPKWMNFVTSGMDICQWNDRSAVTPVDDEDTNGMIQMGVTCSLATKLPINLTINNMNVHGPTTLPTEIGLLTSLQILNLENNYIEGMIPTELCALTDLRYLNLGRNNFRDSIPSCIGNAFSNLEFLIMNDNNGIIGSLPTTISQLTSLRTIFLDGTSLTSGINEVCSLPKFRAANSTGYDVVAYADCGNSGDGTDIEVDCECCRCCADVSNNGAGCSISYEKDLGQDWSKDFNN